MAEKLEEQAQIVFTDANDDEYMVKSEPLAEGGQGKIYLSEDGKIAVKQAFGKISYEKYIKNLNKVRAVYVDDDINIAFPIVPLKEPNIGYVMHFINGGKPLGSLMSSGGSMHDLLDKYNSTGGLKRRLFLLADLARALDALHRNGYAYCDISDNNVFISVMPANVRDLSEANTRVCLIDADNIRRESEIESGIYTPGYGAPEVVLGKSANSINSDLYSFALLAYRVLNINSPFCGGDDDEDCWDESVTSDDAGVGEATKDERGEKAFVFDDTDIVPVGVMPYVFGCTDRLLELFRRAFSYRSRVNYSGRPTAMEWSVALYEAADGLVYCDRCNTYHYGFFSPCGKTIEHSIARVEYLTPITNGATTEYRATDTREVVLDGCTHIYDRKRESVTRRRVCMLDINTDGECKVDIGDADYSFAIYRRGRISTDVFAKRSDCILVFYRDDVYARITVEDRK